LKPFVFHPAAEKELDRAVDYYEERRKGLGLDLQSEVEKILRTIQKDSQRYPPYKSTDFRKASIKRFPYNVFFLELEDCIWIAAVAHHKRKPGYWSRRTPG
jgi:toxin ParE1/3/4